MALEEEFQDVLFHLEACIIQADRESGGQLSDWNVKSALEALIQSYGAEVRGVAPREPNLNEADRMIFSSVRQVSEWELGREGKPPKPARRAAPRPIPPSVEEMVLILKKLRKSAERWQKQGGRRGYLEFVAPYIQ